MTREQVIRIAREAGWSGIYMEWITPTKRTSLTVPVTLEQVERFAALVAAAEREKCAKVCADHPGHIPSNKWNISSALGSCEEAIRALD
jgi:hypothetical protein